MERLHGAFIGLRNIIVTKATFTKAAGDVEDWTRIMEFEAKPIIF